ncbi:flavodoxin domain-containing protein [Colwellia sp. 4_MG-2023]|uniref:flavodoxin domain-containing protein n=1 Tax=unclassified Colwellia TaxID=196834 RepID=UPI0026E38C16|nr:MULTISPECIES: flavodoxin domain-containing protein [unclassified Colwellia]MDO6506873.1 flavodoxin domain-containing protein [Colwellia sp. 5_MG-2023]MDO6555752.1 flavodoxin domain-containing protein [Colwellia sp. 4_MG-2023]
MQSLYLIVVLSVTWLALCFAMWRLHRARLYRKLEPDASILITYASQTGNAQAIAKRCATALNLSENSSVIALNALTLEHLCNIEKILFVVSTYGNGEAPDNGSLFTKLAKALANNPLNHLEYSVIALGDRAYPEFCAFGYQINQTMLSAGAQSLGDVITVDNYNEQTTKLADITPSWIKIDHELTLNPAIKSLQYWQLTQRILLNPDCNDEKLFQLSFKSIGPFPTWQAGDLIDIQPHQSADIVERWLLKNKFNGNTWLTHQGHQQPLRSWLLTRELPKNCSYTLDQLLIKLPYLHKRSYSIASVSQEGELQLIVRLVEKDEPANTFGLASGFLSHDCEIGHIIEGQIRDVSSHHNIDQSQPIILIGAGSGLAGLKAQLAARTFSKHKKTGDSWLIFGERNSNPVLPINQQLFTLQESQLTKLDCAYSQVSSEDAHQRGLTHRKYPKYVQDILLHEQHTLKEWVEEGAVIYVCGCLSGMGEGVHQALIEILGQSMLETLQLQQRYIRDVY